MSVQSSKAFQRFSHLIKAHLVLGFGWSEEELGGFYVMIDCKKRHLTLIKCTSDSYTLEHNKIP